tara:strand:+ start:478 stop:798 length:321 start_codon:yes stop_codon:yes gene_type:complete
MLETILASPWLAAGVVLVTQVIFLFFRTLNVMYVAEHRLMPSIVTGTAIGLAWLVTIAIGVGAMMDGQWQPIAAHVIGGIIGTVWGFWKKGREEIKSKKLREDGNK